MRTLVTCSLNWNQRSEQGAYDPPKLAYTCNLPAPEKPTEIGDRAVQTLRGRVVLSLRSEACQHKSAAKDMLKKRLPLCLYIYVRTTNVTTAEQT